MKYVSEFRSPTAARALARAIAVECASTSTYRLMEFCGGHTHAIFRHGIPDLLPSQIRLIHGPGCPVCVLPRARVDLAIAVAGVPGVVLCVYGDTLRVPGSGRATLQLAKAHGADVRIMVSPLDAIEVAIAEPHRRVVLFAVGFETTAPGTALAVERASLLGLSNFLVLCNHVLTPPALAAVAPGAAIDGYIGPAHVSAVIGASVYEDFVREHERPVVIAGFEPLDVLQAILMLVRQCNAGSARVENQYTRAVTAEGNLKARALIDRVFEVRETFEWRGLGFLPASGLRLRSRYAAFDAEVQLGVVPPAEPDEDHRACKCAAIVRGTSEPFDCKLFARACTPATAIGPCMVSAEGACAAAYSYGRHRLPVVRA
jgi:hydrogenase expression/formation protein HypD